LAQIESVFVSASVDQVERAWEEAGDGRALISPEEAGSQSDTDFVSVIAAEGGCVVLSCRSGSRLRSLLASALTVMRGGSLSRLRARLGPST
jgi:hypothetical protein